MVGYRKPRIVRPKEKNVPKGYDSKWEHKLHTTILKEWEHHSDKISYVVEHEYEPDFVKIIDGKITKITEKFVFIFIPGLKSEPIIDINELKMIGLKDKIVVGENIPVLLEKIEDKNGEVKYKNIFKTILWLFRKKIFGR